MSVHLAAKKGDIADVVLLPGDPMRAQRLAEKYLKNAVCYNEVRGAYGFTGEYQGERLSIQATGMGMPSMSIYAHELFADYDVKTAIRIGTCGAIQQPLAIGDVIIGQAASTDSQMNRLRFAGKDFAATACFELVKKADAVAAKNALTTHVGTVLTSDTFYDENTESWQKFAEYGVLAIEMETAALYTLAAKFSRQALALFTVSDQLITQQRASAEDRQNSFDRMVELGLGVAVS